MQRNHFDRRPLENGLRHLTKYCFKCYCFDMPGSSRDSSWEIDIFPTKNAQKLSSFSDELKSASAQHAHTPTQDTTREKKNLNEWMLNIDPVLSVCVLCLITSETRKQPCDRLLDSHYYTVSAHCMRLSFFSLFFLFVIDKLLGYSWKFLKLSL